MATVKLTPTQKHMLESLASGALLIPHSYNKMVVMSLVKKGLMQATKTYNVGSDYELTEAGRSLLGLEPLPPLVDQPQPADEATIEGEVSFYADGKPQDGTVVCGTDRFGYTVRGVNGKVYDEVQRGDIEPRLGDELDDLPFSDLGELDDEDTKVLPAITVDVPKPTLRNLIDAALDPDNSEAYETLKGYGWASVPLWVLEIEREEVNRHAWDLWHLAHQQNKSNQDSKVARRQCERAFNILSLLNQTIYSFHKGVGFNVEN